MDLPAPEIAGYQLEKVIGTGRATAVYRAYQPQLDRHVAVKVFALAGVGGSRFLIRFRQEIRAIAALHHQNILGLHDYGEAEGVAYVVMDYVPGGSLARRLPEAPLPVPQVLDLILPLTDALVFAHAQGAIHGNVKPSNILLPRPDWPQLVDFGLAGGAGRQARDLQPGTGGEATAYLAPEQVLGEGADARTDLYRLGLVLYELLAGVPPFPAETAAQSTMRRCHEAPPSPRIHNPTVSTALATVLLRALAPDPAARYGQMQAFAGDLRRVRSSIGTDELTVPAAQTITMQLMRHPEVSGPRLFIATSGVALPLPPLEEVLIGRYDQLQPRVPEIDLDPHGGGSAGVSRQHARLVRQPDGWRIEDLRSTNGTYLNEVRLVPGHPIRIRAGDLLRLGQMTLIFEE